MSNTITSKNSWELLLSSIAGAFDGADTFLLGTFDESENYRYKTVITNHRTNEEISKYITAIKLTIPDSGDKISSIKAAFVLEELVVQNDDYITVKILNSTESAELTVLKGKVKILKRDINMMNLNQYSIEIVDEFSKLFEKIVTDDVFLFDKYIYSEQHKENSILYIISKKLGFTDEQMNFEDVRDSQTRLVKIPFMLLRKKNRYIDELQTLLDVTKGRIYIDNMEQLVFQNGLFEYEKAIAYPFDVRNILKNIGIDYKYTDKNGVRVVYDSYKYLSNQVIFDLANKVEVAPGTTTATAKELGIKFITDLATQHNITKAEGYYYENEEQIRIPLLLNTHYEVIEFSETGAKVKFLNPYPSKFYIDKFEIKGIPLAMFSDNEVSIKATKDMLENEENFSSYNKNKYIQTEELASDIARVEYIRNCKNKKEYSFKSNFVPHLEPGDICTLKINDIDTLIQISTIEHTLSRVNGFYSEIVALEYEKIEQEFNYSKIESLTAKDSFLGTLNNIKDQVDETDKKLEEVILIEGARGYVDENDPRDSGKPVGEPDVWFNPTTKEFKVWRNGKWNPAREEDIPPALMTALKAQAGIFRIGGNDTQAGIFFQYDKDKKNPVFGATDSENLAQVSIDKNANVLIRNANNKLSFNVRNPENPSEVISQLLMGVYNADDGERHKDTLFQVGDESTGTFIKFTRDNIGTIAYDGKEVKEHIDESKADALDALDKLDKIASDGWLTASEKTTLEKEWEEIKQEFPKVRDRGTTYKVDVQAYVNSKNALDAYLLPMLNAENFFTDTQINRIEFNSKFTNYYDARINIFVAIEEKVKESAISGANGYADKVIAALGDDLNNQIDGKINTYNQETDPSSGWTADEKIKNTGDLWYKPTEKITKRWTGTTWQNQDAKDTVAQALASSKRRVFTSQPFTPYDAGDLWITDTSSTGDMMICIISRDSGNYVADEWKKATKYTDDTTANEAKLHAQQAKDQATLINQKVESYASDGVITPSEKAELKREVDTIEQEVNPIVDRAGVFGVSIGNIWNTWNDLVWWRTNVLVVAGNYTGDVNSLRTAFKNYYSEREGIFDKIERKAKELADNAQNTGDTAINNQNNGVLTISANTIFDGKATFISKGSNESTIIKDGSVTFTRNGVDITTFRNMRSGVIFTNGNGSGIVEFTGMKTNLSVMTTIKSFNISQNIRSLHCRAEMIDIARNRWKFVIGGTEASTNGKNETITSFSFSKNCYSLSLSNIRIWASNSHIFTSERFTDGITISPNVKIRATITYNDGAGSSRVVYDNTIDVGVTRSDFGDGTVNCGQNTVMNVLKSNVYINELQFSVNQTFSTFNATNKSITVSLSYVSSSITVTTKTCNSPTTKTYYAGNNFNSIYNYINYTTENVQSLTGTGEVQYIAIEQ